MFRRRYAVSSTVARFSRRVHAESLAVTGIRTQRVAIGLALATCLVAGCGTSEPPPTPSPPPQKPTLSLSVAATQISSHAEEIRQAFADDDPAAAHDALHDIGRLLQDLPNLPDVAQLAQPAQEEIRQASETLLDAFTRLDGVLHGGEAVAWDEVGDAIETALGQLSNHAGPVLGAAAGEASSSHEHDESDGDHDHDGHDRGEGDHGGDQHEGHDHDE